MTGPEYDAELEAFLKRRSMMHRRLSDIDHAEPSLEMDRLVLKRAREAIETPAQPLYRTSRWALPMGLAAAILIAFTVVLNLDHHGGKPNPTPAAAAAPRTPAPAVARAASVREPERIEQRRTISDAAPLIASTGSVISPVVPSQRPIADPHASPDAWLREINRLRTAGKTADADRELVAFREAYPSHPAYSVAKPPTR